MRAAGILLPITSLPSKYGIGCFSESAYRFIDFLREAKQGFWQVLPLGQTGYGDSPYQSFSSFAGNPYFVSLEEFVKEGLLTYGECEASELDSDTEYVDYEKQYKNRYPLLRMAYERSNINDNDDFKIFCRKNVYWLEDYSLYTALKESFGQKPFSEWQREYKLGEKQAVESAKRDLKDEIGFCKFIQYKFFEQWNKLKEYANENGVRIIGDIPIYTAADSADVWANPELFQLDKDKRPLFVAGCPPDGFSEEGQLWGNPLYDWTKNQAERFNWWIKRLEHSFSMYDVLRIDHFRGFDEYYSVKYGSKNAVEGEWRKGPGIELFRAAERVLGKKNVIAEDLGYITDSVRKLVRNSGFCGIKVLEFAFDSRDTGSANDYLPHNYPNNCVVYTGTHDNQTLKSWFAELPGDEKLAVRNYLYDYYTPDDKIPDSLIALALQSPADTCIIPMQDWLGLGDEARINTPSTIGNNWKWRMTAEQMSDELSERIGIMTMRYSRMGVKK